MHCDQSNIDEMRIAYGQLMGAYLDCKRAFSLSNDFFKNKSFAVVLADVCQILYKNELLSIEEIEKNKKDENQALADYCNIQEPQSSDLPLDFETYLQNQIESFFQFDEIKQSRFIMFCICLKIPYYQEILHNEYEELRNSNSSEDLLDLVWQIIFDRELIAKITEACIWNKCIKEYIPDWCCDFLTDKMSAINDNISKFFRDRIKYFSKNASEYDAVLFPPKMNKNGDWYCDLQEWKRIIKKFNDYDIWPSAIEKPEYNVAVFYGPVLASKDEHGDISGTIWSDNKPILTKYAQGKP